MYLEQITLINFKNIEQAEIPLSRGINGLVGDNGAGKSNILDAIHYLSMSKSMLLTSDQQAVRHDTSFFMVDGKYVSDRGSREVVSCSYSKGKNIYAKGQKVVKRNGKEYERLSDHVGLIPIVVVSPYDYTLISDTAEERRRFFNQLISQFDPQYLSALIRYNSLLIQRNRLLKEEPVEAMLDIYDQQMRVYSDIICEKRLEVIKAITPRVIHYYEMLSGGRESVTLEYQSKLNDCDFITLMQESRQRDYANGYTSRGLHRDDIIFSIESVPIRKFGSQGQQKCFLIALKLAQYQLYKEHLGESPVLLLDDLFDKLDRSRVEQLIRLVAGDSFGQIIISDCNPDRLRTTLERVTVDYNIYNIDFGRVTIQNRSEKI